MMNILFLKEKFSPSMLDSDRTKFSLDSNYFWYKNKLLIFLDSVIINVSYKKRVFICTSH